MSACTDMRGNWFVVACASIESHRSSWETARVPAVGIDARDNQPLTSGDTQEPCATASLGRPVGTVSIRPSVCILLSDPLLRERVKDILRHAGLDTRNFTRLEDCIRELDHATAACAIVQPTATAGNGLLDLPTLRARYATTPVIVITHDKDLSAAVGAIRNGAFDVVEAPQLDTQLVRAVRAALEKRQCWLDTRETGEEVRRRYARLTPREREVCHLVATGCRSRAIAARLGIREKTVEVYRSRVNHKMNARNAAELAQMLHLLERPFAL